ncbi:hypothetical protein B0H17DRAFT_1126585 [Mycena rosella]|uniref:Uncharacterized protein n=1 Tax=Mycena rosella TaxID=1033263 RepID=A0AAD7GTE7_MYCRO|nr:hypothetical protein B0H17DRAFT_1126585 [Mycena rosella]
MYTVFSALNIQISGRKAKFGEGELQRQGHAVEINRNSSAHASQSLRLEERAHGLGLPNQIPLCRVTARTPRCAWNVGRAEGRNNPACRATDLQALQARKEVGGSEDLDLLAKSTRGRKMELKIGNGSCGPEKVPKCAGWAVILVNHSEKFRSQDERGTNDLGRSKRGTVWKHGHIWDGQRPHWE